MISKGNQKNSEKYLQRFHFIYHEITLNHSYHTLMFVARNHPGHNWTHTIYIKTILHNMFKMPSQLNIKKVKYVTTHVSAPVVPSSGGT
jgi:hypothetical protein